MVYYCSTAARYQKAPICLKWRGPEANGTTQTHCNSPITLPDPFSAHCMYGRHRCQEDPVNSPSGWLEETSMMPPHHMAEHHTAGSEISQFHTAWSNGYGPEPVSVEDVVDVWRYTILSCMPETMTMCPSLHDPDSENIWLWGSLPSRLDMIE